MAVPVLTLKYFLHDLQRYGMGRSFRMTVTLSEWQRGQKNPSANMRASNHCLAAASVGIISVNWIMESPFR